MILLCVDNWIRIDEYYSKHEVVTFRHHLVVSPEENEIDMDDAAFGMTFNETFKRLKDGICHYLGMESENLRLYWDKAILNDEDTPETLGMEATDMKSEELEIHIKTEKIEM